MTALDVREQVVAEPAPESRARARARAFTLLLRAVVTLGLLTVFVAALAAALAAIHLWRAALVLPLVVVLGALAWRATRGLRPPPVGTSAVLALLVVGVAETTWAFLTHSQRLVVFRDPSSYFQTAVGLARWHSTPFNIDPATVGGGQILTLPGVTLDSAAFFEVGSQTHPAVEPQFLVGAPAWYSIGDWLGGSEGIWLVAATFVGLGVVGYGAVVSRVVGPWWGVVAAATLGLAYPTVHAGRATYSEPVSFLALAAGLVVLTELLSGRGRQALAWQVPVLVAGAQVIRLDALRETMLLLPVVALTALRGGHGPARVMAQTTLAVVGASLWIWVSQSKSYLLVNKSSVLPLLVLTVAVGLTCVAAVWLAPRWAGRVPPRVRCAVPYSGAGLVALTALALASRPWWLVSRQAMSNPLLEGFQKAQGLPVDGRQTYAEHSLTWTVWWVGWAAVAAGLAVTVVLTWRVLRTWRDGGRLPAWAALLWVAGGSSTLTWLRPGVVPDHPWADRRLFIALPFVIATSCAGLAWLHRLLRQRRPALATPLATAVACLVLVVPTALATAPHAAERQQVGGLTQVLRACRWFAAGDVAVAVDSRTAYSWPQVLRGTCDVPTVALDSDTLANPTLTRVRLAALEAALREAGKRPVLLAEGPARLRELGVPGGTPTTLVDLVTTTDQSSITNRPDGVARVRVSLVARR